MRLVKLPSVLFQRRTKNDTQDCFFFFFPLPFLSRRAPEAVQVLVGAKESDRPPVGRDGQRGSFPPRLDPFLRLEMQKRICICISSALWLWQKICRTEREKSVPPRALAVYEFGSSAGLWLPALRMRDKHSGMVLFRGISRGTLQEMALNFTVTYAPVYSK